MDLHKAFRPLNYTKALRRLENHHEMNIRPVAFVRNTEASMFILLSIAHPPPVE